MTVFSTDVELQLMNGEAKKYEKETFGKFLYNKENGTVLGRTAKSWCMSILP